VIGGNGSLAGAYALHSRGFPVVGIASTIDNDVHGTGIAIGVDTALNVALEANRCLRATASSHRRAMLVEVMGRSSGYLALMAGIAAGADVIVIPEIDTGPDDVAAEIRQMCERGKNHAIIVVAEGLQRPCSCRAACQGQPGICPADDDPETRAARKHADRVRPPARHTPWRGGGRSLYGWSERGACRGAAREDRHDPTR